MLAFLYIPPAVFPITGIVPKLFHIVVPKGLHQLVVQDVFGSPQLTRRVSFSFGFWGAIPNYGLQETSSVGNVFVNTIVPIGHVTFVVKLALGFQANTGTDLRYYRFAMEYQVLHTDNQPREFRSAVIDIFIVPIVPKVCQGGVLVLQEWFFGVGDMNGNIFHLAVPFMIQDVCIVWNYVGAGTLVVIESSVVRLPALRLWWTKTTHTDSIRGHLHCRRNY